MLRHYFEASSLALLEFSLSITHIDPAVVSEIPQARVQAV